MNALTNKRTVMTLYTSKMCPYCHCVRIALAEKGVVAELVELDPGNPSEELLELNPYGALPTLVDRDLVLYETNIILEYLEERFPHPPLMPVYPVARGRSRLMMVRVDRDWYSLADKILNGTAAEAKQARVDLSDSLLSVAPVFADSPYFLSEEFTLVDCSLAALFWRFPLLGINLTEKQGKPILDYAERLFARPSFKNSLTEEEQEIAEAEDVRG